MSTALLTALFFTVTLLAATAYFLMGSVPLLVLKHDTPQDSRFVRGFFDTYYRIAMFSAGATAVSFAWAGRLTQAIGACVLALLAVALRRKVIAYMDSLSIQIEQGTTGAIQRFRRIHRAAVLVNAVQLTLIVWSLIALSLQLR